VVGSPPAAGRDSATMLWEAPSYRHHA
jgi:hypothetical protein